MDTQIEPQRLAALLQHATQEIFDKMLNLPFAPAGFRVAAEPSEKHTGLISMIGFVGPWVGIGTFYCSAAMGCRIADALFMTAHATVDDEVMDAVAEMANMVVGSVKTELEPELGTLLLSIPTVIYGKNFVKRSLTRRQWVIAAAESGGEPMEIQISLSENPNPELEEAPAAHRMLGLPV